MHSLRKPQWVFLVNIAPLVLLMALCYGEFSVVHTLLPVESVAQWQWFGLGLGVLGLSAGGYAGLQLVRRQPLNAWYSVVVLLAYSLWLCLATTQASELLPGNIPRWMVPTDPTLMAWTFLMPALAHALLALVAKFTPDDRPQKALPNIVFAVATPIAWLVVFHVLEWVLMFDGGGAVTTVIITVLLVLSTLSFFFFLVRAVYIIALRKTGFWADNELVWKSIITTLLPLIGLGVNNGLFFGQGFRGENGIFGNFSSPWFYFLALLNGALLCVPSPVRPLPRLLLFLGRSVLFGFTFYFFLVFLPFLPLSIPAIILIGTGFLLLAPTLLFVLHVRQLSLDVAALHAVYPRAAVTATMVVGLAGLPLYFTGSYWHSRQVLHEALAYVYTPDYTKTTRLDAATLARTLAVIKQHKDQNRDLFFGSQLPYLSSYFNWLVLDNLMLSNDKIADLERVFTGEAEVPAPVFQSFDGAAGGAAPELRNLTASSTYDARQQAWVSWVNLEIANANPATQNGEYSTTITLPTGCWVSDYYLTIGNRQERGILAEKKAAAWVFAQIVNENQSRDPGLVAYRGTNEIAVRVYPVMGREPRRTRIQLLHKEPCTLSVEGRTIALGDSTIAPPVAAPVATPGGGVVYVSALAKQHLPLVRRRPYYHFLLDVSASQATPVAAYQARVARQVAQPLPNGDPARFSLVNAYTTPVAAGADWTQALAQTSPVGGFYLTGAIRRVLFDAQQRPQLTYPVIVVVTDSLKKAVLDQDFEDFSSAYPESDVFYVLKADGQLVPHSLRHASRQPLALRSSDSVRAVAMPAAVRVWPTAAHPQAYLRDNDGADIVLGQPQAVPTAQATPANRWLAGLMLRGYGQWQSFHPETTDRERVPFIQASFRVGIMTPFTSYLALENEAQKAALRRKQTEVLAANASLDTLENDETHPTETPIDSGVAFLLVAGAVLAGWYLRRSGAVVA
ncbi:MSEP-CTERM sorting domain-containing protein [Hymenobacter terrenus]|uniref:MSEP-CTERM sorting domain-containing protein n=1 Tax=Hymenobacter terrenus TaxID=1629124 RepID=UPI0006191B23|nr:MSEP-CTERM sorting domain-containing protein [Hymenobacter terrenus]